MQSRLRRQGAVGDGVGTETRQFFFARCGPGPYGTDVRPGRRAGGPAGTYMRAARFWCEALGYDRREDGFGGWSMVLVPPSGSGTKLALQQSESTFQEHPRIRHARLPGRRTQAGLAGHPRPSRGRAPR
jgi:hypothetical protein